MFQCIYCGTAQEEERPPLPVPERIRANVLYIDIELSKSLYSNYGSKVPSKYLSIDNLEKERYLISWAASYMGKDTVWSECVNSKEAKRWADLTTSQADSDERIVKKLHAMMSSSEIIAGHNVKSFDIPHCFTRFLYYNLPPITHLKTIDTLVIARTKFRFESNKLDYISTRLGLRPKDDITREDWAMALKGDKPTLDKIQKYNIGDVVNGKGVYDKLVKWSGKKQEFGALRGDPHSPIEYLDDILSVVQE